MKLEPPTRMCRVCRLRKPKAELQRWVKVGDQMELDQDQRRPGRGFYACSREHAEKLPFVIRKTGR